MQHKEYTDPYHGSMRDWTPTQKRNAASVELAAAIFKAKAICYGGPPDLDGEPPRVRQDYILWADELLKKLQPVQAPAHVAPFAAVRTNDGLFNFASALARQSFPDATAPHKGPVLVRVKDGAE